ncbi:MAG: alpha/beta hydrolase [Enterococcus sp.]
MKRWHIFTLVGILVLLIGLFAAGNYFFHYAFVPSEKDFLGSDTPGTAKNKEDIARNEWFTNEDNRSTWHITNDGLKLSAIYLPAEKTTNKTVIVAHGYMGDAETMSVYAKMYHDMGYNVLIPDARAQGESEGKYIGFGWPERKDYVKWIDKVIDTNGADSEIVLYGISMGGATVMMTSGEELPSNVKAIVEDCGYTSVKDELSYQMSELFSYLPHFPLMQVTSLITRVREGFFFKDASAVNQLKKNKTPILFIHGDADTFVPYKMLNTLYTATDAPKEKYVVHGAEHAEAYNTDPDKYKATVQSFLNEYVAQN